MTLQITTVDAFASEPFHGNPAAVCILPEPREDRWMQDVAREMNLSETAFLRARPDGFDLRWFTPAVEVDLCGHATLASAHVLWETGVLNPHEQARFHTRSGVLLAERKDGLIEMDFPASPAQPAETPDGMAEALGLAPRYVGRSRFDYLVEAASESIVRDLKPDFHKLRKIPVRGVIVTSQAETQGYDFVSRFFAPGSGIDEDPVTGSAHCTLTPFWSARMKKTEFTAFQASPRGGTLRLRLDGGRVHLGGHAVTVLRAELLV